MAIIPVKIAANCGDNVRLWIETPTMVFDISLEVDENGHVDELGRGHLLIKNKTEADINVMIDNAFKEN